MSKLISVLLAFVVTISSFSASVITGAVSEIFSGAVSLVSDRDSFLEDIDDSDVSQFDENTGYLKNILLVFFDNEASFISKLRALRIIDGSVVGSFRSANLCVVRTSGLNYEKLVSLADKAAALEGVALASICPASRISEEYTPNDPFTQYSDYTEKWNDTEPFGNNWWLEAINARGAWGYNSYFEKINIGIVDGGFDVSHPELEGKISFPNAMCARRNRANNHGTHVSGIIAAKADNGIGISGICQNSALTCVDWSPSDGQVWIADVEIFFGFGYAVKAGAKVINFSLGSSSSIMENDSEMLGIIKNLDAMLYSYYMGALLSRGYDFVVVQSAGNGNDSGAAVDASNNGCFCPINLSNAFVPFFGVKAADVVDRIIIVGNARNAYGGEYVQSGSSNVGDSVDICAPGSNVYSCAKDNSYVNMSGTSMSAPVVTAIASLVWSVNSELDGKQVKQIVCSNTVGTAVPAPEPFFDGLNYKSYGMANAKAAVEAALKTKYEMLDVNLSVSGCKNGSVTLSNSDGDSFVFEPDFSGKIYCLLEAGTYTVSYARNNVQVSAEITVNAQNTVFSL